MNKILKIIDVQDEQILKNFIMNRQKENDKELVQTVEAMIENVKANGDAALQEYTEKFDGVTLEQLELSKQDLDALSDTVDDYFKANLKEAAENITFYHQAQARTGYELKKEDGIVLGQRILPLQRVGIYVPGGRAAYPSTVLMDVIPAKLAGVSEIIMVTPPDQEGKINPYIATAAKIAGVDKIFTVGGAQAIAALAYGTKTIPQVDKIVGPGNIFVAIAKKLVYGHVDIDMVAGPSEILIVADEKANAKYVAADLISQAEHDPLASAILITTSEKLVEEVDAELVKQIAVLPRKEIILESFASYGAAMICETIEECIEISNRIAPEHLELMIEEPRPYLSYVRNAGSVFMGYYTCESIGDYFGGTNHVLPTSGTARFYSPLSVDDFRKKSSYLYYTKEALEKHGDKIMNLAHHENLDGHANAVHVRLEEKA